MCFRFQIFSDFIEEMLCIYCIIYSVPGRVWLHFAISYCKYCKWSHVSPSQVFPSIWVMYVQSLLDFRIVNKGLWTYGRFLLCVNIMRASMVNVVRRTGLSFSVSAGFRFFLSIKWEAFKRYVDTKHKTSYAPTPGQTSLMDRSSPSPDPGHMRPRVLSTDVSCSVLGASARDGIYLLRWLLLAFHL